MKKLLILLPILFVSFNLFCPEMEITLDLGDGDTMEATVNSEAAKDKAEKKASEYRAEFEKLHEAYSASSPEEIRGASELIAIKEEILNIVTE